MNDSRVISSTSSPATVVSCPTFTTRPVTAVCTPIAGTAALPVTTAVPTTAALPTTAAVPTTTIPTAVSPISTTTPTAVSPISTTTPSTEALMNLLTQLGAGAVTPTTTPTFGTSPASIFSNPATQLGALNPFASLAASNPAAALAKLSPALNIFNPAINPNAGLLAFNPAAAATLALSSKAGSATLPFGGVGKLGKIPGKLGII